RQHFAPLDDAAGFHSYLSADGAAVGTDAVADQFQPNPVVAGLALVAQQPRGSIVCGQHNVEAARTGEIAEGAPTANKRAEQVGTGLCLCNWLEAARLVARVPEELGRLRVGVVLLDLVDIGFKVAVAGKQVGPAVEIVIEEKRAEFQ